MKKRMVIAMLLFLAAVLSGCACEHDWTEADCLNPQVCTKCQETGTEALGHDWLAASCTAPETCSRCGEIQGEILDHSYGDWTFSETDMTRSCTACGLEETAQLDRGLYLETLLTGFWEGYCLFHGEEVYSPYQLRAPLDMLHFGEDRTVTGSINTEDVSGTWEFLEYQEKEDEKNYYFSLDTGKEYLWHLLLSQQEDMELVYIFYPNGDQVLLSDNDPLAASMASAGSWGAEGGTGMYSLTFHDDRTVTGNLGAAFEGTWQLLPVEEFYGTQYCGLYIQYIQDGEEILLNGTITPSETSPNAEADTAFTPGTISLRVGDTRCEFQPMTAEEIEEKNQLMQEGPNMILGTWSSIYHRTLGSDSNTDKSMLGYSITFNNDNTFTASVGREISGTWMYAKKSFGDKKAGSHHYYLQLDGDVYYRRVELYYQENQMPELRFWDQTTNANHLKFLVLGKLTEEDSSVIRSLIGSWTSTHDSVNTFSTQERTRTATMEYNFTFLEDGTFTGYDGTDLRGTWNLAYIIYNSGDSRSYYYNLYDSVSKNTNQIIIYTSEDNINVDYRVTTADYQREIDLEQFTQEELDTALLGSTLPIGEWQSMAVTHRGPSGGSNERIETSDYSITLREDGTFTAQLDTELEGTWNFDRFDPDSGYYYRFVFPGQKETRHYYIYVNTEGDFMTFSIETSDKDDFYQMERT